MTGAARHLLATPPGVPGSGRLRYGAAMALHRAGEISDAVLEVYRIAAAHDGRDPAALLAERDLPVPTLPEPSPETRVRALLDAVDGYLATLPGPGLAEARAGIARARRGPVTLHPVPHPVIDRHLAAALQALSVTHPALTRAIAAAAPLLRWGPYDGYPLAEIGAEFAEGHAFASILGGDAPIPARDFDLGLFVIAPHVLYRDHHHAAPELYAPLTGPHGWRFGPDAPLIVKPAHLPVWNPPHRPHLTKVGPVPFLCIFCWTRDVDHLAQVIPASDWPALDLLRLET